MRTGCSDGVERVDAHVERLEHYLPRKPAAPGETDGKRVEVNMLYRDCGSGMKRASWFSATCNRDLGTVCVICAGSLDAAAYSAD